MRKQLLIISIFYLAVFNASAQSIYGVDVYDGNGTINWNLVSQATKDFAYVKASEGAQCTQSQFTTSMTSANPGGVVLGAYHFGLPEDNSAVAEANHFVSIANSYIGQCYLPPALDLENPSNDGCAVNHTQTLVQYFSNLSVLAQWVNDWATQVHSLTGVWPVLYGDRCNVAAPLYPYYQNGTINSNIHLWIADYGTAGDPVNYTGCDWVGWPWVFQQFSAPAQAGNNPTTGANPGMDQDIFNGDLTAFDALTGCGTIITCSGFSTTPSSSPTISASGGSGSFVFSDNGGCSINYDINPCPWVTFSNGSPTGTIDYTVSANCGSAQSCTLDLTYNGNTVTTFTVYQAAASSPGPPSITPSPSSAICPGGQEQLTASETSCTGCSYAWSNGDVGSTITVYPTNSTGYAVTVTNSCGLSATNGYYVDVASLPNQPSILPVSGCSPLSISASSSGCSSCTYTWNTPTGTNNGSPIQGTNSGNYYVTVTNSNGCTASNSAYVTITTAATPSAGISSTNSNPICNTTSTTLSVPSCTGCTYNWSTGAVTNSITVSTAGTYYVTVTNSCLESVNGSYAVTTISAPGNVAISGSNAICLNSNVNLTANPDYSGCTYNWSTYGSSGSNNSISISPTTSEQITVTVTNNCGNAISNPFNITVNNVPPQPGSINGSSTPCAGSQQTYTVSLTGGDTYTWILPTGWTNSSNSNSVTTTVGTSSGTISVTANNNCGSSTPQTLNVNPVYVVASPLTCSPNPVCQNGTVTLTANSGGATYQWSGNHVVNTNSNTTTATPTVSGSAIYSVIETVNTCTASATVNVTVTPTVTPSLSFSQSPSSVCLDGTHSVTITPNPVNGGTPSYSWSSNCSTGSNGSVYTLNDLSTPCFVSCTLTSNAQCASPTTATASVNVQITTPLQAGVSISTPATSVCVGSNVTFTAIPVNGGNPTYEWYVGGTASGTGQSFTIYNIQNSESVYCSMTSSLACTTGSPATSNTVNVVVVTQATASVSITDSPSTNVCAGTQITFTANPGNGGTNPLYQWRINGTDTGSISASRTFSASTLSNGDIISCHMTSNSTCVTIDTANSNPLNVSVTPTVAPIISISANPTGIICSGTPVTFTAIASNQGNTPTYQWIAGGNDVGTNSTIYTSSSLTNDEVVVCKLTSSANCASPDKLTSNSITVSVDPVVLPSVEILTSPVGAVCIHTNITFTASSTYGGNSPSYKWMVNGSNIPDTTGVYSSSSLTNGDIVSCELISSTTCAVPDTASMFITVAVDSTITPSVIISANPSSATCAGTSITFMATPTGGGVASYQWKVNNNNTGNNSSTFTAPSIVNDTVTCFMTSSLGCASPATVSGNTVLLFVKPAPDTTITPEGNIHLCAGDSVQLNASASNLLYHWNVGPTTSGIWVTDGGEYWATVTNSYNCSALSTSVTVSVNQLPATPVITQHEDTLTTSPVAVSYQWYLNNVAIIGATGSMLVVLQNGLYRVAVTDTNGCSSTSEITHITTVGIDAVPDIFNYTLAPNPSHGQFVISFETSVAEDIQILILDPIGRVIKTESPVKVSGVYSREINLPGAASGLYIIQMKSEDKIMNKKFEIN